jgi:hypothetical protein
MTDEVSLNLSFLPIDEVTLNLNFSPIDDVSLSLELNSFSRDGTGNTGYLYNQVSVASTWTINHNLGYKPIVQLYTTGSYLMTGTVVHTSDSQTVATFTTPVAGFARLT